MKGARYQFDEMTRSYKQTAVVNSKLKYPAQIVIEKARRPDIAERAHYVMLAEGGGELISGLIPTTAPGQFAADLKHTAKNGKTNKVRVVVVFDLTKSIMTIVEKGKGRAR